MKKLLQTILALTLALALLLSARGEMMSTSKKQDIFNKTLGELEAYLMDLREDPARLNAIAKQFYDLGGVPQSRQLWYYASVLLKIANAEFDMQLDTYLTILSQMPEFDEFITSLGSTPIAGTAKLAAYARGREAEYKNDPDAAAAYYEQCMNFYDVSDRYMSFVMQKAVSAYERGSAYLSANDPAAAYMEFLTSEDYAESRAMLAAIEEQIGYAPENEKDNPGSVQKLAVRRTDAASVTLGWDAAAHASRYTVEYRRAGESAWKQAGETNSTEYTVSGLESGKAYDFLVTAYAQRFKTAGSKLENVTAAAAPAALSEGYTPKAGEIVTFGSYEQDNDTSNGKEPIEWEVLNVESDGTCLLISRYALDAKPYNTEKKNVTWETCTLRDWLNNSFRNTAFNAEEQNRIALTKNENADNPVYGTKGGNDTVDYVFPLSPEEVEKYYSINKNTGTGNEHYWIGENRLIKKPTEYAKAQGAYSYQDGNMAGWWWLRSPGSESNCAVNVGSIGKVYISGNIISRTEFGVVPAIRVRPSADDTAPSSDSDDGAAAQPQDTGRAPVFTPYSAGDTVKFGSYEQDNHTSTGKEAIEWTVLDVSNDGVCLLISKYALDCKPYNAAQKDVTWETCSLRNWLNGSFYNNAFSAAEREKIVLTKNKNADNPVYGTDGGNDTNDYVFILSHDEIEKYYGVNKNTGAGNEWYWYVGDGLRAAPSRYAAAQGADSYDGASWYWLRSTGCSGLYACYVFSGGTLYLNGSVVTQADIGVVPAVRVRLF